MAQTNPSNSKSRGAFGDEDETAPALTGKSHFLGIGITDYDDDGFDKLPNARKDVTDLSNVLSKQYGFILKQEYLLFDKDASRANIIDALDALCDQKNSPLTPEDRLLIYYAGHGWQNKDTAAGYWIPTEAKPGKIHSYVSNAQLRDDFIKNLPCRHVLLISDSCFSESLIHRGTLPLKGAFQDFERKHSRWVITSGKDVVSDGKAGKNSPFNEAILDTLRDNRQPLNAMLFFDTVKKLVDLNYEQKAACTPIFGAGDKGGQFVFMPVVSDEAQDWIAAESTATAAAYEQFLKKHPGDGARQQAAKEAFAYLTAKETRRHKDLMHFLENYSNSPHEDEILALLNIIEVEVIWQKVNKNIWAELYKFLKEHPGSPFAADARQMMADLKAKTDEERLKRETATEAARIEKERLAAEAEVERARQQAAEAKKPNWTDEANQLLLAKTWKDKLLGYFAAPPALVKFSDPFKDLMIPIEGGKFNMGDEHGDLGSYGLPVHEVSVKDFHLGKYPVTQAQWRAVMGSDPPELRFKGCDQCPVEEVSWYDIQVFLDTLNQKTGMNYRLPSEAEWEFAARGGAKSKKFKFSGSDSLDEVGWFWENSGNKRLSGPLNSNAISKNNCRTHPVGGKKANEFSLFDMSGNVWEWCQDLWHDDYKGTPVDGTPSGPGGNGNCHVLRGGSCFHLPQNCRSANRFSYNPHNRYLVIGFRVAQGW